MKPDYKTEHALLPLAWAEYLAYGDSRKLTDAERLAADREARELGDLVSYSKFPSVTRRDHPLAQCVFIRAYKALASPYV